LSAGWTAADPSQKMAATRLPQAPNVAAPENRKIAFATCRVRPFSTTSGWTLSGHGVYPEHSPPLPLREAGSGAAGLRFTLLGTKPCEVALGHFFDRRIGRLGALFAAEAKSRDVGDTESVCRFVERDDFIRKLLGKQRM